MTITLRESTAYAIALIVALALLSMSILAFDAGWNFRSQQERREQAEWREKVSRAQLRAKEATDDRILRAETEIKSLKKHYGAIHPKGKSNWRD